MCLFRDIIRITLKIVVPLQCQNEDGFGAPRAEKDSLTCTRKIALVWSQK